VREPENGASRLADQPRDSHDLTVESAVRPGHAVQKVGGATVLALPPPGRMTDVRRKSLGRPARYALVLLGLYLTYLVLRPFLAALTWAVMFAILFHRMQAALTRRMSPGRAAGLTTAVVAIAIVAPAIFLISTLAREAPQVFDHLKQSSEQVPGQLQHTWDAVRARSPVPMPENPMDAVKSGAQRALTFLAPHAGAVVTDSVAMLGTLAAMLFALFFMLRDGESLCRRVRDRLPFPEDESERLMNATRDLVNASFGASLIVAGAQGLIGGVAFWLLGIGAPVFWGVVMAFCSLLPIGASIIWLPAGIGLLLSGSTTRGVLMLVVGLFGISGVDNVLRPALLSGKTSISGFVIFFGLLGGGAAFGLIGLVIGPIILVVTSQLLEYLRRPGLEDDSPVPDNPPLASEAG